MNLRLPHPFVLLLGAVAVAALLTWVIPAGEYQRRTDAATGREVVVAGTYTPVAASRVGLKGTLLAAQVDYGRWLRFAIPSGRLVGGTRRSHRSHPGSIVFGKRADHDV